MMKASTSSDERVEVRAGLAEIERGQIASDDEVGAVYKRIGADRTRGVHVHDM